jgi:hypothetical protein
MPKARPPGPEQEAVMLDIVYLGLGAAIFALMAAYVRLCDRI